MPWDVSALVRLAACRAAVVQHAHFCQVHRPGRLEAVRQLTSLTSLALTARSEEAYEHEQPGQVLAQQQLGLAALPQLRRLSLDVAGLLGPSCQQLAAARQLTSLILVDFLHEVSLPWQLAAPPLVCFHDVPCALDQWPGRRHAICHPLFLSLCLQVPDALWDAVACMPAPCTPSTPLLLLSAAVCGSAWQLAPSWRTWYWSTALWMGMAMKLVRLLIYLPSCVAVLPGRLQAYAVRQAFSVPSALATALSQGIQPVLICLIPL